MHSGSKGVRARQHPSQAQHRQRVQGRRAARGFSLWAPTVGVYPMAAGGSHTDTETVASAAAVA